MRFIRIVVKNFQAIESADVSLGPALNILFGPNDLGKSTLACAMRAALLVPPSSSEGTRYLPWFVDAVPEVTLTFVDDESRFWRVRKCFGATSAQSSADLDHSKDGSTFTHESGGREVDERLRELLGWGIPSPGGKGAPRKLPTSFLAQVLLAEQSDVETILRQSTDGDGATSGHDRLRKALAALAEDPWFKRVLTETQVRVAQFFTPTGQFRRGRGSPFTAASDDLKRRAEKVERLRRDVADSLNTEEHAGRLREEYSAAHERWQDVAAQLATVRLQHKRATERSRADEVLALARGVVERIQQQEKDAADFAEGLTGHAAELVKEEARLLEACAATESADAAVRGAEESLRAVTSEEGAHRREVTRANLKGELAELGYARLQNVKRGESVERAQTAIAKVTIAKQTMSELQAATVRACGAEEEWTRTLTNAHAELELARHTVAYGQWHAAEAAARQAAEAREAATTAEADAAEKETLAQELEADAATSEAAVIARRSLLPDAALMKRLEELEHQLAVAEAALGGGFSLALRGTGKVPVHVTIDDGEVLAGTALQGRLILDAARKSLVRVGDLLDVEIIAGAAEKRHALEGLRERWINEAEPVLQRATETNLARTRERIDGIAGLEATVAGQRGTAKHLRLEAETARQSARMKTQRAEELTELSREADSMKARLGTLDLGLIAASFHGLGDMWREEAEQLIAAKEQAVEQARKSAEESRRLREMTAYQFSEAEGKAAIAQADAQGTFAALGLESNGDVDESRAISAELASVQAELAAISSRQLAIDGELGALEHEASDALRAAIAFADETKAVRARMLESQTHAAKSLEDARSAFHAARGELDARRKALDGVDRAGAEARAVDAQTNVDLFAGELLASAEQVGAAERLESEAKATLDQVRAELNQAEGALMKVGGHGIRDELKREDEAYSLARDRQRELEIDAEAWKLLGEALEESEKEGSTHLGRILAAPVSARFAELTMGRYGALHLDQHLKAETVDIPAVTIDGGILEALSVGTRDQIATLLRLTIAEQLKSAIVLDDHLVHTDPERLGWFREMLRKTALSTQVIVLTCRPQDYLDSNELPDGETSRDLAGGAVRTINAEKVVRRWHA